MAADSFQQRLHFAWTLGRRHPLPFLLGAGHRLLVPLDRRLAQRAALRAEKRFDDRYGRQLTGIRGLALWGRGLGHVLPAACMRRDKYLALWEHTRVQVLAHAEKICAHRFNLLGSGEVDLGEEIDWHRDFKSGRRWPLLPAYRLQLVYPEDQSDIKVPWELSRFQHLPLLGKAYWLTGEERYAREFRRQVEDWLAKNPLGQGPNWAVAMEAAIRTVNWLYAANFFVGSLSLTEEFWSALARSLFLHGWFIRRHLEWSPYARGNHYLAGLVGLVYLGAFFADFPEGRAWLGFAAQALAREFDHQVRGDGVVHEASLGYHRLVTELFLAGCLIAARNLGGGEVCAVKLETLFGRARLHKLEEMLEFVLHYTRPDGLAPLVGDADDGRLVQLAGYGTSHPADHRHLLATGAVLFNRRDFRQAAGAAWEEAWWLVGTPPPPAVFGGPTLSSRAFPAGGFFILRTPDVYVLIRCGDVGREGIGGHAHCDQLSFELAVGRQPLVIDPGSYVYTADLGVRHRFRSTSSHNTVRVAGAEQNRIRVEDCFQMPDDTHARVRHWRSEPEVDEFEGEHLGYRRLPARVVHRRAMTLDKAESALYLADHLAGRGRVRLEWFFHLAPGVTVGRPAEARPRALARLEEFKPERSALASAYSLIGGNRAVTLWVFSPLPLGDEVTEGWVSPRYGVCEQGSVVSFSAEAELPLSLLFVFDLAPG